MTGRIALPIPIVAALLALAAGMPQAAAQAVGPDEAHGAPARLAPHIALSPAQKRAIYATVSRQRLRTSAADIPLVVGATVSRSAALLTLPDAARGGDLSGQDLKYAMVDDNVVLVDSISMRVIDIIHHAGP
ncbi:MAG TPA: hypothetical protein VHZ64_15870 [Xanthobacteraceae bacterium]|jgi:hypothetical protein|nr:hypothetical protein [Xanthobacteraceae bacterium]